MTTPSAGGSGGEAVDDALGLRTGALPSGSFVLITDEVEASGGFLVAHFLRRALGAAEAEASAACHVAHPSGPSAAAGGAPSDVDGPPPPSWMNGPRGPRVCLVAAEQTVGHHAQALRKLGRNMAADVNAGRLVVVDALTRPFRWCVEAEANKPPGGGIDGAGAQAQAAGVLGYTHSGQNTAARDLFDVITRALGGSGDAGGTARAGGNPAGRVVIFDSLSAVAEAEMAAGLNSAVGADGVQKDGRAATGGSPPTMDGRVAALLRSCAALPSCATVALTHADASGGHEWAAAAERCADVTVACVGLRTGGAEDVHGHIRVIHRTGRMMPESWEVVGGAGEVAAMGAAGDLRGLSLGRMSDREEDGGAVRPPPRAISARFQLTEMGPRVTRIHGPSAAR